MIGSTISHYKILEKLGEGGMGLVYKAEDVKLRRIVALKFLPAEFTFDPDAKERFAHEAQAASAFEHPNICSIYEINETAAGRSFIVMGYYGGETLKHRIQRGALSVEEAVAIVLQIAEGLARAHEAGIVHRDIKPENIMITERGEVKVLDFGLAKLGGMTRITRTGTTVGTVAYMSPEQARGDEVERFSGNYGIALLSWWYPSSLLIAHSSPQCRSLYVLMPGIRTASAFGTAGIHLRMSIPAWYLPGAANRGCSRSPRDPQ